MNRVYCLYRVSDRGQVEKNDIPMQRIACRTFAQERGWEIEKELSEKGISGYKLTMQQRDAILEIREAALAGKFDILLVRMPMASTSGIPAFSQISGAGCAMRCATVTCFPGT